MPPDAHILERRLCLDATGPRRAVVGRDQIAGWLSPFFTADDVFEVRGLNVDRPGRQFTGFFRGDERGIQIAAGKIAALAPSAGGIYFTPQRLNPSVLARSDHRLVACGRKGDVVTPQPARDEDVTARRFLLVDVDPVKAAGFEKQSASLAEKDAAWELVGPVREFFDAARWPAPLVADSGNGWHLYYPLPELLPGGPVDSDADPLVQLLRRLAARFNTDGATIDTRVGNPSRIMKVLGTWALKGDDTPDRPHRPCVLVEMPDWSRADASGARSIGELIESLPAPSTATVAIVPVGRPAAIAVAAAARTPSVGGIITHPKDLPLETRIRAAKKHLEKKPGGIDGQFGSNPTFSAARAVAYGCCLDEEQTLAILLTDFNHKCVPPWSEGELRHKVKDALSKPFRKDYGWGLTQAMEAHNRRVLRQPVVPPPDADVAGHPAGRAMRPSILPRAIQFRDVVGESLSALVRANDPPRVFVHGDMLIKLDPSLSTGNIQTLGKNRLRLCLSQAADFHKEVKGADGETCLKPDTPDDKLVGSIMDHIDWPGLPRLTTVADVPVFTKASGLLTKPGFDAASGVYLLDSGYVLVDPVSDSPDGHEVEAARDLILDDLLGDFPFKNDGSRANALALYLLPFVRDLIDGPTPLHHIDAPQEGTGKSLFAETWGKVALGRDLPSFGEITKPEDWQKLILAALIEAPRVIYLDNLSHTLKSSNLAMALTQPVVSGRLLGFSRIVNPPVRCVWISSGNNVSMSKELIRRLAPIQLDANCHVAWKGRTFKHDLSTWPMANRGKLVWACLTLCQAWVAAGMPAGRQLSGKYEVWSRVLDGILSNAGVTSLLSNHQEFGETATVTDQDQWAELVSEWWRQYSGRKVAVKHLYPIAVDQQLNKLLGKGDADDKRTHLGEGLTRCRDRVYLVEQPDGGTVQVKLIKEKKKHRDGGNAYRLEPIDPTTMYDGPADDADVIPD